ncbi:MAG TPA: type II toxin-antitoxin system prevent-host-death family antitoxin [Candidatus Aquilonibacter sp.]
MKDRLAGIRYARQHLSALINDVKDGHEWVIAERGKPVARIVPIGDEQLSTYDRLLKMEAQGLASRPPAEELDVRFPIAGNGGILQQYLQEDRGD